MKHFAFDNSLFGQFDGQSGSCEYDPARQAYTLAGQAAFVWKRLAGNFIVTARVGASAAGPAGWMARAGLDPAAAHVSAEVQPDGRVGLRVRQTTGGSVNETPLPVSGADVIQLERRGDTFILSAARYGEPFSAIQMDQIPLGESLYVGLFGEAGAAFDNVRIVVPVADGFERGRDPFGSHLEVLDLASGQRRIIHSSDDIFEAPNWTRDGRALIYNSGGRLFRFDLATGTPAPIDTGDVIRNNNDHVISFDGTRLAISSHAGEEYHSLVYTLPLQGGQPRLVTPTGPSYLHGWSADDQFLVYTALRNGDYDIYRIPVEGGEEVQLTTAIGLDDGPEYTPDGKYIYFNSVRSGRMQIWRMRPDGSHQEQLTDDEYNNWFPHISPDGKQIVFVTYLVNEVDPGDHPPAKRVYLRLMPLDGGTPRVVAYLYGGQGTMNVPSWSPDGRQLAFVSNTVPRR
jgi:Tol biopolymer transport system component